MRSEITMLACGVLLPLMLGAQAAPMPPGTTDGDAGQIQTQAQTAASPLAGIEPAIDDKEYDKARGLLDAYLSAHPDDARALFDRGYCDDTQGKTC
ncbi:MAG: hypothetical protein WBP63_00585, partial [Silvibacterium sp.]